MAYISGLFFQRWCVPRSHWLYITFITTLRHCEMRRKSNVYMVFWYISLPSRCDGGVPAQRFYMVLVFLRVWDPPTRRRVGVLLCSLLCVCVCVRLTFLLLPYLVWWCRLCIFPVRNLFEGMGTLLTIGTVLFFGAIFYLYLVSRQSFEPTHSMSSSDVCRILLLLF